MEHPSTKHEEFMTEQEKRNLQYQELQRYLMTASSPQRKALQELT